MVSRRYGDEDYSQITTMLADALEMIKAEIGGDLEEFLALDEDLLCYNRIHSPESPVVKAKQRRQ